MPRQRLYDSQGLIRTTLIVITALGVVISLWGVCHTFILYPPGNDECEWRPVTGQKGLKIDKIVPGGVADAAGLKNGDILIKFNDTEFTSSGQASALLNAVPRGQFAKYDVLREGKTLVFWVEIRKLVNITLLAMAVLGFVFMLAGVTAAVIKPRGFLQRQFWLYSLSTMVVFTLPSSTRPAKLLSQISLYLNDFGLFATFSHYRLDLLNLFVAMVAITVCMPRLITFFFDFPSKIVGKRLRLALNLLIYSVCITRLAAFTGLFGNTLPALLFTNVFNPFFFFTTGLVVFFIAYFLETNKEKQRQTRPILYSVLLGFAVMTYLFVISVSKPFAIFISPYLLLPALLIVAVPMGFGYSIFRYGLMDFDLVLRRSLVYGGVTAGIASVYLAMIFGVGSVAKSVFGIAENLWFSVAALMVVAVALDPLKRRAQRAVDRIFFREQLNYRRILTESAHEIHILTTVADVITTTTRRVQTAMHTERVTISFYGSDSFPTASDVPDGIAELPQSAKRLLSKYRRPIYVAQTDSELREISPADRAAILSSGVELLAPLLVQDAVIGSMNVGRKLNGKPFSGEDIELLATVAMQAAAAMENSRLHQTEKETIKLQEELSVARTIQQGLLPEYDPHPGAFDISGVSNPAMVVGGDYFDYIHLSTEKTIVIIADVSGKGMPAALYMAKFQGMMQIAARMHASPKETLIHLNERLIEVSDRRMFISAAVALIDVPQQTITLCRAGHPAPLLHHPDGKTEFLRPGGLALGLAKGAKFANTLEEVVLRPEHGDTLVFYTDGVTETHNHTGDDFGDENIVNVLRSNEFPNAAAVKTALLDELDRFRGDAEQYDDTTIMVIRVDGLPRE